MIQQLYMITIGIRKNSCNTAFCYQNVAIFTVLCDNPELSQSDYQSNDVSKINRSVAMLHISHKSERPVSKFQ